jgi:hypothetical protein
MLLWASILLAVVGGIGVANFGAPHWIGDLLALIFVVSLFVAVCATETSS